MSKRLLRVVKWMGERPLVGVCTECGREFTVPLQSLSRVGEAKAFLKSQFDKHKCAAAAAENSNGASEPSWL